VSTAPLKSGRSSSGRRATRAAGRPAGAALTVTAIGLVLAAPVTGDDVHLENGRVFEDVIATVTETHVVIEMEYGRMRLPRAQVARVEERTTPLETFRDRRSALLADPASPAGSWAQLALWAWAHGLERDATETALLAVRLDRNVEGLEGMLTHRGYERDSELGWVPHAVAMERRGLVFYGGEWMTPERRSELRAQELAAREAAAEAAARIAAEREERRRGETEAGSGPTANDVALASIDLAREIGAGRIGVTVARTSSLSALHPVFIPTLPLSGSGGFWAGGDRDGKHGGPPGPGSPARARVEADWEALSSRIPGSRLPISAFRQPPR